MNAAELKRLVAGIERNFGNYAWDSFDYSVLSDTTRSEAERVREVQRWRDAVNRHYLRDEKKPSKNDSDPSLYLMPKRGSNGDWYLLDKNTHWAYMSMPAGPDGFGYLGGREGINMAFGREGLSGEWNLLANQYLTDGDGHGKPPVYLMPVDSKVFGQFINSYSRN